MTLEKRIETICEYMPDGWRIRIDLEKHSGTVTAIRPDGTEVDMGDGERDIEEQCADALHLAFDELKAAEMDLANNPAKPGRAQHDIGSG